MADRVILAAVAGAHGLGGEVRLKVFADGLESLKRHKLFYIGERALTLTSVRPGRAGAIARFAGVDHRAAAEALRGTLLTIPREALPALGGGEYYHADLIGLSCESAEGAPLGMVVAVENFGAGDLLEIEKPGGKRALIPFKVGIANLVDGKIVADPDFLA